MIGQVYCEAYVWLLQAKDGLARLQNERHLHACILMRMARAAQNAAIATEEMRRVLAMLAEKDEGEG